MANVNNKKQLISGIFTETNIISLKNEEPNECITLGKFEFQIKKDNFKMQKYIYFIQINCMIIICCKNYLIVQIYQIL